MPRPTLLTTDRANRIITMIRGGAYVITAAKACGIGESTYFQWTKRGREADKNPDGTAVHPADQPYVEFSEAVKVAEAEAEVQSVASIRAAGATSWQAHAWYLERRYPDRWARRDTIRQEVTGGLLTGQVEVDAEAQVRAFLSGRHELLVATGLATDEAAAEGDDVDGSGG